MTERVSLWLARIDDRSLFDSFLGVSYSEGGIYQNSIFGESFLTEYYDEDFREAEILTEYSSDLKRLLTGFSYEEIIVPKFAELIPKLNENFNSVIMLYNYTYSGVVKEYQGNGIYCKFIGCLSTTANQLY